MLIPRNIFPHTMHDLISAAVKEEKNWYPLLFKYLDVNDGIIAGSGREALFMILSALLERGDEIIVPAFSCNAVLGPIIAAGAVPVFSDVDPESLNMECPQLKNCVTEKTKAVLATHQFGYAADLTPILEFCHDHNLLVIEDCAPALGSTYKGKKVGTFGDVAFFSFEKSKVISTLEGGVIVGKKNNIEKIRSTQKKSLKLSSTAYFGHALKYYTLLNPFFYSALINVWYAVTHTYSKAHVYRIETDDFKKGHFHRLSRIQNNLGLQEFLKINSILESRRAVARMYRHELRNIDKIIGFPQNDMRFRTHTYSRFPILVKNKMDVYKKVRRHGIDLGFTFSYTLTDYFPPDDKTYKNTEYLVSHILNIPISRDPKMNKKIIQKVKCALS